MRDLVVAVREAHPSWLDEQSMTYLRDVTDHAFRVIERWLHAPETAAREDRGFCRGSWRILRRR